jgi:hypothetical protein
MVQWSKTYAQNILPSHLFQPPSLARPQKYTAILASAKGKISREDAGGGPCLGWATRTWQRDLIGSIRFRNSTTLMRNVFIYNGDVVLVTDYHKARSATNLSHVVARFLPKAVGELVLIYIIYIRPFANMLYSHVSKVQNITDCDYLSASRHGPINPGGANTSPLLCEKRVINTWERASLHGATGILQWL